MLRLTALTKAIVALQSLAVARRLISCSRLLECFHELICLVWPDANRRVLRASTPILIQISVATRLISPFNFTWQGQLIALQFLFEF